MITVLNPAPFQRLVRRLDAAVRADASLAPAASRVLAPLRLLAALGRDAEAALGDDQTAVERVRLLAASGNGHAGSLGLLHGLELGSPPTAPLAPGLVHAGGLVLVALAADRAGRQIGIGRALVDNVLGVALSAAPAEAINRALSTGLSDEGLVGVLGGLIPQEAADSRLAGTVAVFLADPEERHRWQCLQSLFEQIADESDAVAWEATAPLSLVLEPAAGCPGEALTLRVASAHDPIEPSGTGFPIASALTSSAGAVVFASCGRPALTAAVTSADPGAGRVVVRIPQDARSGWVGVVLAAAREASNKARSALRARWRRLNKSTPCLASAPVPVEAIVDLPDPPSPPRPGAPRFEGGLPSIVTFAAEPAVVDAGESFELRWQVEGAESLEIRPGSRTVESPGSLSVTATDQHRTLVYSLVATSPCDAVTGTAEVRVRARIRDLDLSQSGRGAPYVAGQPLEVRVSYTPADAPMQAAVELEGTTIALAGDGGICSGEIPPELAVQGLRGRVTLATDAGEIEDERAFGPLTFVQARSRRVALLRPAVFADGFQRVTSSEARDAISGAGRRAGLAVELHEPVWVEDQDLAFEGDPGGAPTATAILERLGMVAARHPDLAGACWVALVPSTSEAGALFVSPGDATPLLAVCTPDRLSEVFAAEAQEAGTTTRLRITGTLLDGAIFSPDTSVVEVRGAGPGTGNDIGLTACVLDARNQVQAQLPLRTVRNGLPAALVALVPVSPQTTAVELRADSDAAMELRRALRLRAIGADLEPPIEPPLARFERPEGEPRIADVHWDGSTLRWKFSHSRGGASALWVEIRRNGVWLPGIPLGECQTAIKLPLQRLGPGQKGDRVRVAASDGWHSAAEPPEGIPISEIPSIRTVVRRLAPGRFWADVDGGGEGGAEMVWRQGGDTTAGPVLETADELALDLSLEARVGDSSAVDVLPAPKPLDRGRRRRLAIHG